MSKSKVHMPKDLEMKCHVAIHTATTAAGAAGAGGGGGGAGPDESL